jgi:hypothetical protein
VIYAPPGVVIPVKCESSICAACVTALTSLLTGSCGTLRSGSTSCNSSHRSMLWLQPIPRSRPSVESATSLAFLAARIRTTGSDGTQRAVDFHKPHNQCWRVLSVP